MRITLSTGISALILALHLASPIVNGQEATSAVANPVETASTPAPGNNGGPELTMGDTAIAAPSYLGKQVYVYPERNKHVVFFATPVASLKNPGANAARVDGKNVIAEFVFYPYELRQVIAESMTLFATALNDQTVYSGPLPITADQILAAPLDGMRIAFNDSMKGVIPPYEIRDGILLNESDIVIWQCESAEQAETVADRINKQLALFTVEFFFRGYEEQGVSVKITSKQLQDANWINDIAPGRDPYLPTQYYKLDQVATALAKASRAVSVQAVIDKDYKLEFSQSWIDNLVNQFMTIAMEDKILTFQEGALQGADDIYIGDKSFDPDTITKEAREEASNIETLCDSFAERLYASKDSGDKLFTAENLQKEMRQHIASGNVNSKVSVLDILDVGADVSGSSDYKKEFETLSKSLSREQWLKEVSTAFKEHAVEKTNKSNSTRYAFEGEKIIPKELKLKRVVESKISDKVTLDNSVQYAAASTRHLATPRDSMLRSGVVDTPYISLEKKCNDLGKGIAALQDVLNDRSNNLDSKIEEVRAETQRAHEGVARTQQTHTDFLSTFGYLFGDNARLLVNRIQVQDRYVGNKEKQHTVFRFVGPEGGHVNQSTLHCCFIQTFLGMEQSLDAATHEK